MLGIKSSKALPQVVAPPDLASDPHTRSSLESKSPARHSFLPNSGLPEEEERRRSRETSEEENVNQGVDVATTRAPELHRGVGSGKQSKKRRVSWTFNFAPSNSASPVVSELQEGGSSSLIDRCRDIHHNHQKRVSLITMVRENEEIPTHQVFGAYNKPSIGLTGVFMQRIVSWIQHYPDEETEDSESLDWSSRQAGPLYVSIFVVIFSSIFTAVYFIVGWKTHACVGFGAITFITLGITWQKWMNAKRYRSLQLNMRIYNSFFVAIIFVAPVLIQLLEGGTRVCNKAADCITVSIVSPVCYIYISRFDLSHTQFRPSKIVLAMIFARALIIILSVVFSGHLLSTFPVKDEEEQHIHLYASNVFYSHLYIFPFVVVMFTFQTIISGFQRRGARIVKQKKKNKERAAKLMDMVKGIVLLDVWSGELRKKHPSDWWRQVPVESWEDTAILNTDIAGFTKLSSLLGPEELIPIINCLFSAVDFAASCLDCWKCEMVGDCWVGITGGPIPCKDRALRTLLLSWAINDIVEDISKRLGLTIAVRIGLHTGTVATSIVSSIMPRFLIFGKDAEIARLMEQSGERGKVLVSESFASLLPGWEMEETKTVFLHTGEAVRCCYVVDPRPMYSQNHDVYVEALEESFPRLGTFLHLLKLEDNNVHGMPPDDRVAHKSKKASRFGGEFLRSAMPSASVWKHPNGKRILRSRSMDSGKDPLAGWIPKRQYDSSAGLSDSAMHQEPLQAQPSGQRPQSPLALSSWMEGVSPLPPKTQTDARPDLPGSANLTPLGVVTPSRRNMKPSESSKLSPWAQDPASHRSPVGLQQMMITSVGEVNVDDSFSWARRRTLPAKESDCTHKARSPGNEHSSTSRLGVSTSCDDMDRLWRAKKGWSSSDPRADKKMKKRGLKHVSRDAVQHMKNIITAHVSMTNLRQEVNHQELARAKSSPMKKNGAYSPFFHDLSGAEESFSRSVMESDVTNSSHVSFHHSKNFNVALKRKDNRPHHATNKGQSALAVSRCCRLFLPRFRIVCLITCSAVCIFQALAWSLDDHFVEYDTAGMRMAVISCSAIFAALCTIVATWEAVGGSVSCTAASICLLISSSIIFGFGWEDYHSRASILWSFLGSSVLMASYDSLVDSPLIVIRISAFVHVVLVIGTQLLVARSNRDSCNADNLERMSGIPWSIHALYIIHQTVPSSLLLFPIEFAVWRLSLAERDEETTLDKFGMLAKVTSQIFGALLPRSIAVTLSDCSSTGKGGALRGMDGGNILIAEKFRETTVLFAYVVGYEEYALTYPPEVVIKWIQAVFAAFDDIVEPRNARGYSDMVDDSTHGGMNVVKFETFHDFYFLVSGCPQQNDKHAEECVSTALQLVRAASGILNPAGEQTHLKLGINSGAVCAGVIGDDSPRFTCIGDTVNTASRMASTSFSCTLDEALCIQISDSTRKRLSSEYLEILRSGKHTGLGNVQVEVIPRSIPIDVKGKGLMETSIVRIVGQKLPWDQGGAMPESRKAAAAEIKQTTADREATVVQSSPLTPLKNTSNDWNQDTNSSDTSSSFKHWP